MTVAPEDEGFIAFNDYKCSLIGIAWDKFNEAAERHYFSNKRSHGPIEQKQAFKNSSSIMFFAGPTSTSYFESQIWGYYGKNNDTWDYAFQYLGMFMPTKKFEDVRYVIAIQDLAFTFNAKDLDQFFEVMKECPGYEERIKNWQTGIDFRALKKIKSIKVFKYEN